MLHLKKVLGAKPKEHAKAELAELLTPWGEALDVEHVLEEHPTPQFARQRWQTLNGVWRCAFVESGHDPALGPELEHVVASAAVPPDGAFDQDIIVPFSPEASLSGVRRQLQPDELLWYRRTFDQPEMGAGERLVLHFQAVDYACACWVNGQLAGTHVGGYTPFSFDITDFVSAGENDVALAVADPSEFGGQLRGKQRFDRGDIWYTAQSGIWQTVWLEIVPAAHIIEARIEPDAETGILVVGVRCELGKGARRIEGEMPGATDASAPDSESSRPSGPSDPSKSSDLRVRLEVRDAQGSLVGETSCAAEATCALGVRVADLHRWSPEDPYLYQLDLRLGDDAVGSYCGFRTVELRRDGQGHPRVFLNGEPVFVKGVLDQAYWPDGLMTAPADGALAFDIEQMRSAGFNLMRKHIKLESERWYYHCDRLGILVMQDMVQGGGGEIRPWHWSYKPTLFRSSWGRYRDDVVSHQRNLGSDSPAYQREWVETCRETVRLLANHPSVISWCLFNEGWGQFDAERACAMVRRLDPTRVIDAVSGWYDQRCGDFSSVHNYFRDLAVWPCRQGRAFIISEFGGFSHLAAGHASLPESYGYEVYEDAATWRRAVRAVLSEAAALEPLGLAGYIYTQVSDIEEETNGLLTYDRRINKLEVVPTDCA